MMLKSKSSQSPRGAWALLRAGLAGLAVMAGGAAVTAGCLDRPVSPAVPKTSNVYVDEIRQTAVDKIDLLFMIDNSISMADKQAILAEAVPLLVQRLITPICVRSCTPEDNCTPAQERDGIPTMGNANAAGECATGNAEFNPIKDIHVGVITSSLGSHGAVGPKDVCVSAEDDDHAHLLGQIRPGLTTYNNSGFLKWDTTNSKYSPPGDSDSAAFTEKFTAMVKSSGEKGCGYEASLEAWYRFLVDPEPPLAIDVAADSRAFPRLGADGKIVVDDVVLAQRQAFLRPDSLVAIIMLSDENDCSIQDEGYGWLIARGAPMYRSTSACAANPNDKCCQSCGEATANAGCGDIKSDAECVKGQFLNQPGDSDDLNLRCWQQKRRFGFDLLYPTYRYSEALRSNTVRTRTGETVTNPLFAGSDTKPPRDRGLVFLAGIVGVPWQDIADEDSLAGAGLRYLTSAEIEEKGRWDVILGQPNDLTNEAPVLPKDPLMVETPVDRTTLAIPQMNPVTGDVLVPSSSTNPKANPINGHEQANMGDRDLQYACTFPLATPITCDAAAFEADKGCDCFEADKPYNRPLCQPPGGGAADITQHYAKAYPGLRHLQVLREFKDNSVVASICPKVLAPGPDYGYNPAVKAIIDRLKEALKGKCLPRPLVPATEDKAGIAKDQVPCAVIEATLPEAGAACACDAAANRIALDGSDPRNTTPRPELRDAVLNKLKQNESCDVQGGNACADYCTCEIAQLAGDELRSCQNDSSPPNIPGYCYINAAPNEPQVGNPDLVKECTADSKRLLRFVGGTPAQGSITMVACLGASLGSQ